MYVNRIKKSYLSVICLYKPTKPITYYKDRLLLNSSPSPYCKGLIFSLFKSEPVRKSASKPKSNSAIHVNKIPFANLLVLKNTLKITNKNNKQNRP